MDNSSPRQSNDHDLLIRLEVVVNTISKDIREMKDGTAKELAQHDLRLKRIEQLLDTTNFEQAMEDFKKTQQLVHDTVVTANAFRMIAGFIGGLVVFLLTQLPSIIQQLTNVR